MATDKPMEEVRKQVKELEESFGSLAAAMINVREIKFMKVNQTLKDITLTSSTTGRIWLAMARVVSGSGLWKFQNKVKAWADWLRFRQQFAEAALKKEQEVIKEFGKQVKWKDDLLLMESKLDKLGTGSLKRHEQEVILADERVRYLMKMMPFEMARKQALDDVTDTLKKIDKSTKNYDKERIKNMQKFLKGKDDELIKLGEFNALSREQKVVAMDLLDIEAQGKKLYGQMSKDEKEAFDLRARKTVDRAKELGVTATDDKITGTKTPSFMEQVMGNFESFRKKYQVQSRDKKTGRFGENQFSLFKFFKKEFPGLKLYNKIKATDFKEMFSKERLLEHGRKLGKIAMAAGKILLGITLAVVALISLQKLGIFDLLSDMFGSLMKALGRFWKRGGRLLTSIGEWLGSIVELWHSLFSDDGTFIKKLIAFGWASWDLINKLFAFFFIWIKDLAVLFIKDIFTWFERQFIETRGWGLGLFNALLTFLSFHYTRLFVANMLPDGVKYAGAIALVGGLGAAATTHSAFANGGITGSGWSLVGEKGPELVRLPAGSRVFSNADSQRMGNNITVNVQGRVGASDAEVRDIANKIGRLVNSQINRNVTTGIRGA